MNNSPASMCVNKMEKMTTVIKFSTAAKIQSEQLLLKKPLLYYILPHSHMRWHLNVFFPLDQMSWSDLYMCVCVFFHSADYVFFENSSSNPYLIRRIEELNKVTTRSVPVVFLCVSSTWCLGVNSRDSSQRRSQPLPLFVTHCVCVNLVIKKGYVWVWQVFHGFQPSVHIKWHTCQSACVGGDDYCNGWCTHSAWGFYNSVLFFPQNYFYQFSFIGFFFFFLTFYSVFLSFPRWL